MTATELLQDKRIPLSRLASAATAAVFIVGTIALLLRRITRKLELAFTSDVENPTIASASAGFLMMCYPLLAMLGLGLVLPLCVYVSDHAPFQSLQILRPDHYFQLVWRVYRTWLGADGGKLKAKEL